MFNHLLDKRISGTLVILKREYLCPEAQNLDEVHEVLHIPSLLHIPEQKGKCVAKNHTWKYTQNRNSKIKDH